MLSYKHGYHAGNHADVLKHIILLYLYSLEKKLNKSISYVDTHSGNGIYKYTSKYMDRNKEYKFGIKKIEKYEGNNQLIINYLKKIKTITLNNNFYPGSPYLICGLSNSLDKLYLCELHNNEYVSLKKNLNKFTNTKVINENGFNYIKKLLNKEKNFFVFIDPSYEIKDDFEEIHDVLDNFQDNYTKSKFIIWYPIIDYTDNDKFIESIRKKGLNNIINIELPILSNNENIGMKGSGLLILNFNEKKIIKNLKSLLKELHFNLKQSNDVYNPKVRYL